MGLRLAVMATGTFAMPAFRALADSDHEVVGLVTQPDRQGRGHHQHVNVLKEFAIERGIDVFQPERIKTEDSLEQLRRWGIDLFVVAAYGQILTSKVLSVPRLGAINLHGSLLPAYRGAAPIQYAIWKGESRTGVTIFQIEPRLDSGPVYGMVETQILPNETSGELHDRLAELCVPLTLDVVSQLEAGTAVGVAQDESRVSLAPRINKDDGSIDWTQSTEKIGWHLRAMRPWPSPFTFLHQEARPSQRMVILEIQSDHRDLAIEDLYPGQVVVAQQEDLIVRTGDGCAKILTLQPAGKKAMSAADFLRGTRLLRGETFGPELR